MRRRKGINFPRKPLSHSLNASNAKMLLTIEAGFSRESQEMRGEIRSPVPVSQESDILIRYFANTLKKDRIQPVLADFPMNCIVMHQLSLVSLVQIEFSS